MVSTKYHSPTEGAFPDLASGFYWLDGAGSADLALWQHAWEHSEQRHPHYHPAFVAALAPASRHPAAALYVGQREAQVLYAFSLGALASLDFCPISLSTSCDIQSPYGYGGPSYSGPEDLRDTVQAEFRELFRRACQSHGVVSEFVRQDLFSDHLVEDEGEVIPQQDNVVVRLGLSEDGHLARYRHKVRKNVRRARESGLRFEMDSAGEHLEEFASVYAETMERVSASASYRFPPRVFEDLTRELAPANALAYAHVFDGDRLVSSELLLLSRDVVYSFLGGTLEEAMPKRPNDLLKHEVILWAGAHGYRYYVLGGGATPGDGVFQYKLAFDPDSVMPFYVRRRIHDQVAYQRLVSARGRARPDTLDTEFFPAYRA